MLEAISIGVYLKIRMFHKTIDIFQVIGQLMLLATTRVNHRTSSTETKDAL